MVANALLIQNVGRNWRWKLRDLDSVATGHDVNVSLAPSTFVLTAPQCLVDGHFIDSFLTRVKSVCVCVFTFHMFSHPHTHTHTHIFGLPLSITL